VNDDERFIAHLTALLRRETEREPGPLDAAALKVDVIAAAAGAAVDDPMSLPPIDDDPAANLVATGLRR
jgi:hypothetical protein